VRQQCQVINRLYLRFNPRTREGCDASPPMKRATYPVSIHAPARGATLSIEYFQLNTIRFNPRTREGCDLILCSGLIGFSKFQSTHPRGVRQIVAICVRMQISVSIHAPARGATLFINSTITILHVSIHAPARGATIWNFGSEFMGLVSIHAPARGATRPYPLDIAVPMFQSTHPRGVRRSFYIWHFVLCI